MPRRGLGSSAVALGRGGREVLGVNFPTFVAPGLIAMAMMQNAFANSSFSLLSGKIQGTIIDLLVPPLSEGELMGGIIGAAITRAVWSVSKRSSFRELAALGRVSTCVRCGLGPGPHLDRRLATHAGQVICTTIAVMLSLPPRLLASWMNFSTATFGPSAMCGAISSSLR